MINKNIIFMLLTLSVMIAACTPKTNSDQNNVNTDSLSQEDKDAGIQVTQDGIKYLIHPDKIRRGIPGPGDIRDRIPAIDNPKFVPQEDAEEWIEDNELVMAIIHKGIKRIYPLQIMVWHEIVNDVIGGDNILVTYCPLCGSGIAFKGEIDGERVTFGTSGKLLNSNLIMYDRKTNSYWTQVAGRAIIGELTGTELEPFSVDTVVWRDWKKLHSDAQVLSRETGHIRNYGQDPYGSYYEDSSLFFPVENTDNRIHSKTVIFGIEIDGVYKAYREESLIDTPVIEDTFNGVELKIERDEAGIVKINRVDTGEEVIKERDFWFAWYAFHPETELYTIDTT